MDLEEARHTLALCENPEEPVTLSASILPKLTIEDLPENGAFQVGDVEDRVTHLDWEGTVYRYENAIFGEAEYLWTRKYWHSPLGLEQYLDLVRRAVETRHRLRGDVELTHYDDDGAYVALRFRISTRATNVGRAYDVIRKVANDVQEAADRAADEVGERVAEVAARLSGWGSESLDALVEAVETATSADDKGRTLEELCSRLFGSVPGFTVTVRWTPNVGQPEPPSKV